LYIERMGSKLIGKNSRRDPKGVGVSHERMPNIPFKRN